MAYTPTQWVNGKPPALNAENLNKLEAGIQNNDAEINSINADLGELKSDLTNTTRKTNALVTTDEFAWLEQDLELVSGKFIKVNGTSEDGIENTWAQATRSKMIPVSEGEILKISGRGQLNVPLCVFFSSDIISHNNFVGSTELVTDNTPYRDYDITIPSGVTHIIAQTNDETNYPIIVKKFANLIITNIADELEKCVQFEHEKQVAYQVTKGKMYQRGEQTPTSMGGGFECAEVPVVSGEKIKISGWAFDETNSPSFWSESELVEQTDVIGNDGAGGYSNIELIVPHGATRLLINGRYSTNQNVSAVILTTTDKSKELFNRINLAAETSSTNEYEIAQLERRVLRAEKNNDFAWKTFDKPYFVFIHDDMNSYYTGFANLFHSLNVPLGAATVVQRLDENKIATMRQMVADGGEVLAHYDSSPTESSTDAEWLSITRDVKKALESYGFDVRGIIIANSTQGSTNKGEKYCRRYFDYANDHMGKSTQYNLPRSLMLNYSDYDSFKSAITSKLSQNGIHAFGFHGGRADESWITNENLTDIINYIRNNGGEITTYSRLFDEFGTTVLEKRLSALESAN